MAEPFPGIPGQSEEDKLKRTTKDTKYHEGNYPALTSCAFVSFAVKGATDFTARNP
jgi:hypothetical protein